MELCREMYEDRPNPKRECKRPIDHDGNHGYAHVRVFHFDQLQPISNFIDSSGPEMGSLALPAWALGEHAASVNEHRRCNYAIEGYEQWEDGRRYFNIIRVSGGMPMKPVEIEMFE